MASQSFPALNWVIREVIDSRRHALWSSDGRPVVGVVRGGVNASSRLIVQNLGFLDISVHSGAVYIIEFNDAKRQFGPNLPDFARTPLQVVLTIHTNNSFMATVYTNQNSPLILSGSFLPLPSISIDDVRFFRDMIAQNYVPYPTTEGGAPGKTDAEIRALGQRLFPWSPHSFELAMAVYDWTTASFTRMVFLLVFQYALLTQRPLDSSSIALMIWESNWGPYRPSNPVFMRSFLMIPAATREEVDRQMSKPALASRLRLFAAVGNRILRAGADSLPRTPILAQPYLYSGQVDIYQMGTSRFGIGFMQFPGNRGPVNQPLQIQLAAALASFVRPGSIITTKMVWAFTDTKQDAMHYSNGILLIVQPSTDHLVWREPSYVTGLSNDPQKTEWIFPPGSRFRVLSLYDAREGGRTIQVIQMEVLPRLPHDIFTGDDVEPEAYELVDAGEEAVGMQAEAGETVEVESLKGLLRDAEGEAGKMVRDLGFVGEEGELLVSDDALVTQVKQGTEAMQLFKGAMPDVEQIPPGEEPAGDHVKEHRTNGRWCNCVDKFLKSEGTAA